MKLFSCPEEGCTKTYQRFSALQHQLDIEKHERALEHETLLDKAVHGYADRLDEQFARVQIQQSSEGVTSLSQTTLPMGNVFSQASEEFLTSQQISSLFSRTAAKRALPIDLGIDDEQSTEHEQQFEELRNRVIVEVVPKHPICYNNSNLCKLVKESKLSIFSISMLQKICEQFDIPTAEITGKQKAPYISKLIEFVKNCSCHSISS